MHPHLRAFIGQIYHGAIAKAVASICTQVYTLIFFFFILPSFWRLVRMSTLKIAIVSTDFPPTTGGEAEYAAHVARVLSERGHEVVVYTTKGNKGRHEGYKVFDELSGIWWHDRRVVGEKFAFDILHIMNSAWNWMVCLGRPTFVSIHGNDFANPNPVYGLGVKTFLGLPWGDRMDFWLAAKITPTLMRRSFSRCAGIFSNSTFTKREFESRFPECPTSVKVAGVGVSPSFLGTELPLASRSSAQPRFLTVCRLSERRKNIDLVLHALATLKSRYSFHYTIVGDGYLRSNLETIAAENGLSGRVTFAGKVTESELISYYTTSDLFVLPSSVSNHSFEGFGIAYLEANAFGTPTMAFRGGGAQEAIDEGRTGFFVDEPSVAAIEEGLRRFLDGELPFSSDECRCFAHHFTWERVVDSIEPIYSTAIPNHE